MAGQNGTTAALPKLSAEDERRFLIVGMEEEKVRLQARMSYLDAKISEIKQHGMIGTPTVTTTKAQATSSSKGKGGRRKISDAARKAMSDAQKRRWAAKKGEQVAEGTEQATVAAAAPPSPLGEAANV